MWSSQEAANPFKGEAGDLGGWLAVRSSNQMDGGLLCVTEDAFNRKKIGKRTIFHGMKLYLHIFSASQFLALANNCLRFKYVHLFL